MMACSVHTLLAQFALVFLIGTSIALYMHSACLSWTVACSLDVLLLWVALLLTQLALFLAAQGVVDLSRLHGWNLCEPCLMGPHFGWLSFLVPFQVPLSLLSGHVACPF